MVNTANSRGSRALGRLPGSQREIRSSAKYSGMTHTDLLIGADANLANLTVALAQHPGIVHFAVHVVSPPGHPEQAALALSLGKDNIPELLTRERIASLRVPGSLVVLSGCTSGQGETTPSAGLIGLSRAWLLAGARAVVVSNWPTPDDSGRFFDVFYSQLSSSHLFSSQLPEALSGSLAKRVARALQQAQLQMQQHGGYGSAPAFWAAYSIVSEE
jgi:CHAT domain-containing protein